MLNAKFTGFARKMEADLGTGSEICSRSVNSIGRQKDPSSGVIGGFKSFWAPKQRC